MTRFRNHAGLCLAAMPVLFSYTSPALASAGGAGDMLDEIIITAQRRSESIQDAALSINAVTGDSLTSAGAVNLGDLAKVAPALQAFNQAPYTQVSIRGIYSQVGNGLADPSVLFSADGAPISKNSSTRGLMFDIARMEILKGPQGTLYGRNTTGGAINLISNAPQLGTLSGKASVQVGNYSELTTEGMINAPIGDTLAVRFAGLRTAHDGYMSSDRDDQDMWGVRGSLLWVPTEAITTTLRIDRVIEKGNGPDSTAVATTAPFAFFGDPRTSIVDQSTVLKNGRTCGLALGSLGAGAPFPCPAMQIQPYLDNDYLGLTGQLDWKLGDGTFTSIASHRDDNIDFLNAARGFPISEVNKSKSNTLEARYSLDSSGPVKGTVGAFYADLKQSSQQHFEQVQLGYISSQTFKLTNSTWAAFADGTYGFTDTLRASVGVRYTTESKKFDGQFGLQPYFRIGTDPAPANYFPPGRLNSRGDKTWHATNWRAALDWKWREKSLLFFNVATGFKSGTFAFTPDPDPSANPEQVRTYTVGSKNTFLDGRLLVNLELFRSNYTDQQLAVVSYAQTIPTLRVVTFQNAGSSRIKGAELETSVRVTKTTRLNADFQYLHTRIERFSPRTVLQGVPACSFTVLGAAPAPGLPLPIRTDCTGNSLPRSPKWSVTAGVQQDVVLGNEGRLTFDLSYQYVGKQYADSSFNPITLMPAYARADASVTYTPSSDRWSGQLFVRNLDDGNDIVNRATAIGYLSSGFAQLLPPRTWGLRLGAKFGNQ